MFEKIQYENDLPIKIEVLQIKKYPWHIHKDIQIIYVIEGEIELKMTYTRYRLVKNNIHIIHNDDVHGLRGLTKDNLVVVLSLNVDYFSKYYINLDTQVFTTRVSENIATYKKQLLLKTYIFAIISELHSKGKGYKERIIKTSQDLIDVLYKDFRGFTVNTEKRIFEHTVSHDIMQTDRISRIVSFVYQNYPYKLSLTDIAQQEGINSYYLSHLFQRLIGDSFRNFVSMTRVEMSEIELLTTDTSISQISSNVGFSNTKYYVENFKRWFGCHPKEYRQLYRDEILGRAPAPSVKELPLDSINEAIEPYEELPAFTGAASKIKSATFDLKRINSFDKMTTHMAAPRDFYAGYEPQTDCIMFLKELLEDPAKAQLPQTATDTEENKNGAFTYNGMKKPLYYLRQFLMRQYELIGAQGSWYMITSNGTDVQILFFNESPVESRELEFNFFHMPGNYQVTEHRLCASSSCISLWKKLDFKESLTSSEKRQIQEMSAPRISWKTVSSSGSFTCPAKVQPLDIVFVELKRLGNQQP